MAMIMLMSGILTLFVFFIVFGGENFEAPKRFEYTGHEKGEGKGIIRYKRGKKETEKHNTTTNETCQRRSGEGRRARHRERGRKREKTI